MPLYTLTQKKAIYKYREAHTEEYLTNCKQYYLENKEKLKSMRRNLYHYREEFNYDKECKRLRKILLLDI
jgi:hypothetical protein